MDLLAAYKWVGKSFNQKFVIFKGSVIAMRPDCRCVGRWSGIMSLIASAVVSVAN